MRTVGIKVLKNKLSEYVKIAASGETVLVTERDRVVAELTAPSASRATHTYDAVLADMVKQGVLQGPLNVSAPLPSPPPIGKLKDILADLDQDRADR